MNPGTSLSFSNPIFICPGKIAKYCVPALLGPILLTSLPCMSLLITAAYPHAQEIGFNMGTVVTVAFLRQAQFRLDQG